MTPYYENSGITIYHGKNEVVLFEFADNTFDAIVTDPPYGLKFMGKKWDYDVPSVDQWKEHFRVLKPGGYLLSFAGTRTQHRMACNIEDAGFEIRDMIAWVYAQGFPKGQDVGWELHKKACNWHGCMVVYAHEKDNKKRGFSEIPKHTMRFMRGTYLQEAVYACAECGQVLQPFLQEQNTQEFRAAWAKSELIWPKQSCMERRGNMETSQRKLQRCEVCQMSHGIIADGAEGWIRNGASVSNGTIPWAFIEEDGSYTSYRPQSIEQYHRKPNALSVERAAQTHRGFNVALKPACEPITVARKPLSEKTVAKNVLKWGTGGINVDASRIRTDETLSFGSREIGDGIKYSKCKPTTPGVQNSQGRFPANLIHDGSEEVMKLFPETKSGKLSPHHNIGDGGVSKFSVNKYKQHTFKDYGGDSGSAARFFYCAKASRAERGKYNNHPTVKPLALIKYLITLVSKEGDLILDGFCGSGTTLVSAKELNRRAVGIDDDINSCEIAANRLAQEMLPFKMLG